MRKSGRANTDAMLRHLASHHDPQDFPSTAYERQALIEAAGKRRLIEWQKDRRRYELTASGWRRLRRNRGLGVPALAISVGLGAAIGAAALAMLWLPTGRSVGGPAALGPPVVNVSALKPASPPPGGSTPDTPPAAAPVAAASVVPPAPAEPATSTEPPAATQPSAEPAPPAAKPPAAKKFRHRTVKRRGRWNWNFGHRYRDERYVGMDRR
jgi:hypothetical protein